MIKKSLNSFYFHSLEIYFPSTTLQPIKEDSEEFLFFHIFLPLAVSVFMRCGYFPVLNRNKIFKKY